MGLWKWSMWGVKASDNRSRMGKSENSMVKVYMSSQYQWRRIWMNGCFHSSATSVWSSILSPLSRGSLTKLYINFLKNSNLAIVPPLRHAPLAVGPFQKPPMLRPVNFVCTCIYTTINYSANVSINYVNPVKSCKRLGKSKACVNARMKWCSRDAAWQRSVHRGSSACRLLRSTSRSRPHPD